MFSFVDFRNPLMGLKVNHIYDLYKLYMDTPVGDPSWTDLEDFPCHEPDMKERIKWVLSKRHVHWNTYNPEDKPKEDEMVCPIAGCQAKGPGKPVQTLRHVQSIRHCVLLAKKLGVPHNSFLNIADCELCGSALFIQRDDSLGRHRVRCMDKWLSSQSRSTKKNTESSRVHPYSKNCLKRRALRQIPEYSSIASSSKTIIDEDHSDVITNRPPVHQSAILEDTNINDRSLLLPGGGINHQESDYFTTAIPLVSQPVYSFVGQDNTFTTLPNFFPEQNFYSSLFLENTGCLQPPALDLASGALFVSNLHGYENVPLELPFPSSLSPNKNTELTALASNPCTCVHGCIDWCSPCDAVFAVLL